MLDMYGKVGCINDVECFMVELKDLKLVFDIVIYIILINVYNWFGCFEECI